MIEQSEVTRRRKVLGANLLELFFDEKLYKEIDKIPIQFNPKENISSRCCVYKDRAMSRYRLMSLMGIDIELEDDEYKSLEDFAKISLKREKPDNNKIITIVDMSCDSCQQHSNVVTNICRGCEARPCETNCPKDAIQVINGKSIINNDDCVSCGKCSKVCPFNAIIYSPVPCEKDCPVDAISRNTSTGKEEIDYDKCIYCGRCIQACPFGTVVERSQILYVANQLKNKTEDKPIIALLAPSIVGQFPGKLGQTISALKEIGFDYVYEVAQGADITAKHEAEELIENEKKGQPILGTSCCPAYVESVRKHITEFEPYLSSTKTPMSYIADIAKNDYSESGCVTVFIGPCIAKKLEGYNDDSVDYVLTFEELSSFILSKNMEIAKLPVSDYDTNDASYVARNFCVAEGVASAVQYYANEIDPDFEVKPAFIDGLDKKGLRMLKSAAKGKISANILECMSCEGGCVAGPGVIVKPTVSARKLKSFNKKPKLVITD